MGPQMVENFLKPALAGKLLGAHPAAVVATEQTAAGATADAKEWTAAKFKKIDKSPLRWEW